VSDSDQAALPWVSRSVFLIGLLWATGLRISEALKLRAEDVDLDSRIPSLRIRETKHFKSRIVPISASTARALRIYRDRSAPYRDAAFPNEANHGSFFIHENGRPLAKQTVQWIFQRCLITAGLKLPASRGPRLHDLRHTFATRALAGQRERRRNPDVMLPMLAVYPGHTHVADTDLYLHPQPEQLRAAGELFAGHLKTDRSASRDRKRGPLPA
jgi:integrase/recombinase XerD